MKKLDDLFLEKVLKHGSAIVSHLSILSRLVAVYEPGNDTVIAAATRLTAGIDAIIGKEGELSLTMAGRSFFMEDSRIKASYSDLETFDSLMKDLAEREIGAINFIAPVAARDVIHFAVGLKNRGKADSLQSDLERNLIRSISVGGPVPVRNEDALYSRDARMTARRAYLAALASFSELCTSFDLRRLPSMKKAKRAIHSLVDSILNAEVWMLGCTGADEIGDYNRLHHHSINVAVLSIVIGKRIGFTKSTLGLLGIAALLHDIGKIELQPALLDKSMGLTGERTELSENHPAEGVRILLRFKGLTEMNIVCMMAAYEHHMNRDCSGYPRTFRGKEPGLLSQIVGVADAYDTLTNAKIFGERMLMPMEAPREALCIMHARSNDKFDPTLVQVLASAITGR